MVRSRINPKSHFIDANSPILCYFIQKLQEGLLMADARETARIREEYHWFYPILFTIIALILGISIGAWLFAGENPVLEGNILSYVSNLWTEAISIGITVIILDRINQWRNSQSRIRELKENLIHEVRSVNNTIAIHATNELRDRDWLVGEKGILQGANLENANLQGVDFADTNLQETELSYANLQSARLTFANLQEVHLHEANLYEANLAYANLQKAQLYKANLQKADLIGANLVEANIMQADLRQANLEYADLQNAILANVNLQAAYLEKSNLRGAILVNSALQAANLLGAQYNERTALPDAEYTSRDAQGNMLFDKYWTRETDMSRYTNPEHPDFWQPTWIEAQKSAEV
jgi:uncharacterized protein YjbI with pentapeptide repeats